MKPQIKKRFCKVIVSWNYLNDTYMYKGILGVYLLTSIVSKYHMCIKFHGLISMVLIGKKVREVLVFVAMVAW